MHQFKKILVWVNTKSMQHHALMRAAKLAKRSGAVVKAVDVVKPPPVWRPSMTTPPWLLPTAIAKEKSRRLEKLVSPLRMKGIRVETEVFHGSGPIEVIREVLRKRHDLLMRTAEKEALSRLFGASDMRLLRKCPCPVWLVKPTRPRRHSRILAAVDIEGLEPERRTVDEKIMELATTISRLEGGELHVIHAWRAFGESVLKGYSGVPSDEVKQYLKEARAAARQKFAEFVSQYEKDVPPERAHLVKGHPARVIAKFAKQHRIDLIVMGTLARAGVAGVLIGNTAENVVGLIDCSLLAIKTDNFVSPVKLDS